MRILIVDDEPELVEQIRQALTRQKYTVDTASDGIEAMDRIYVDSYDLMSTGHNASEKRWVWCSC